jgi:hypothetical protein
MTVGELMALLRHFDPTLRVVTPGFDEAGIEDISEPEIIGVRFDVNPPNAHIGPHEEDLHGTPCVKIDF